MYNCFWELLLKRGDCCLFRDPDVTSSSRAWEAALAGGVRPRGDHRERMKPRCPPSRGRVTPPLVWMGCMLAPAKEPLGTLRDPWGPLGTLGDMACVSTQKSRLRTPEGTIGQGGFGACSRVWVLEVEEFTQPDHPIALLEKQKGQITVFLSYLTKRS